jgi:hypothetical protein
MVAILSLHDRAVRWPSESEKRGASNWIEKHSCAAWRPGFAMVDGTLIPLYAKPARFGNQFYDRKSNYSLGVQVSADVFVSFMLAHRFIPSDHQST